MVDAAEMVRRLRERLWLKYVGDCKCHQCHLVHGDDVIEAADLIERQAAEIAELKEAAANEVMERSLNGG